jgi:hypothetical protein
MAKEHDVEATPEQPSNSEATKQQHSNVLGDTKEDLVANPLQSTRKYFTIPSIDVAEFFDGIRSDPQLSHLINSAYQEDYIKSVSHIVFPERIGCLIYPPSMSNNTVSICEPLKPVCEPLQPVCKCRWNVPEGQLCQHSADATGYCFARLDGTKYPNPDPAEQTPKQTSWMQDVRDNYRSNSVRMQGSSNMRQTRSMPPPETRKTSGFNIQDLPAQLSHMGPSSAPKSSTLLGGFNTQGPSAPKSSMAPLSVPKLSMILGGFNNQDSPASKSSMAPPSPQKASMVSKQPQAHVPWRSKDDMYAVQPVQDKLFRHRKFEGEMIFGQPRPQPQKRHFTQSNPQ